MANMHKVTYFFVFFLNCHIFNANTIQNINFINVSEVDFIPSIVSNGGGSSAHVEVSENSTFVTDVQTVDNISTEANGRLSYFIEGGVDKSFFNIDKSTGEVSFNFAPDFENPIEADGDNTYEVGG